MNDNCDIINNIIKEIDITHLDTYGIFLYLILKIIATYDMSNKEDFKQKCVNLIKNTDKSRERIFDDL